MVQLEYYVNIYSSCGILKILLGNKLDIENSYTCLAWFMLQIITAVYLKNKM
jgi:hypothetical protein